MGNHNDLSRNACSEQLLVGLDDTRYNPNYNETRSRPVDDNLHPGSSMHKL